MLPILYAWPGVVAKKQLAPDVFVAFVPDHSRTSYDLDDEGQFPPFVLEVVSPSSSARDQVEKRQAYEALGAQEYARFGP
jgi:Uma2 family endonuclease